MEGFQIEIIIWNLAIRLAAIFTTPVPLSPANLLICVDILPRSCFFLLLDNSLQFFLASPSSSSSSSSLSPIMSLSRLFNWEFSSLRRRISWVLGSCPADEVELRLTLRFGLKNCPWPMFTAYDVADALERVLELSERFPSHPPNIVSQWHWSTGV